MAICHELGEGWGQPQPGHHRGLEGCSHCRASRVKRGPGGSRAQAEGPHHPWKAPTGEAQRPRQGQDLGKGPAGAAQPSHLTRMDPETSGAPDAGCSGHTEACRRGRQPGQWCCPREQSGPRLGFLPGNGSVPGAWPGHKFTLAGFTDRRCCPVSPHLGWAQMHSHTLHLPTLPWQDTVPTAGQHAAWGPGWSLMPGWKVSRMDPHRSHQGKRGPMFLPTGHPSGLRLSPLLWGPLSVHCHHRPVCGQPWGLLGAAGQTGSPAPCEVGGSSGARAVRVGACSVSLACSCQAVHVLGSL